MQFDIDGSGAREALASVYTTLIYEQEFGTSLIKDVFGKFDLSDGGTTQTVSAELVESRLRAELGDGLTGEVAAAIRRAFPVTVSTTVDYTLDNWEAYLRALWAMFRCAREAGRTDRDVPPFKQWLMGLGSVDMWEVSRFVIGACSRDLFRASAQVEGASE